MTVVVTHSKNGDVGKLNSTRNMLIYVFFVLFFIGIIFFEATLPPSVGSAVIPHLDKVAHFLAFGLLGFLLLNAMRPVWMSVLWKDVMLVCVLVVLVSVADEYVQAFNVTRQASLGDVLAGALGAFTVTLWVKIRRKQP